jgi:hypothetical protein
MDPRDLVQAAMRGDDLATRQWVKDAKRARVDFSQVAEPNLDGDARVVAAALVELFAQRQGRQAPAWTQQAGHASKPIFLVQTARSYKALRRLSERTTPRALRERNVFALGDYLDVM